MYRIKEEVITWLFFSRRFCSQSVTSELKSRLCDFLSASDTLLLNKEIRLNLQQKEMHLGKILESMCLCREALKVPI